MPDAVITSLDDASQSTLSLESFVPTNLLARAREDERRSIPAITRDEDTVREIEAAVKQVPTTDRVLLGDSRGMDDVSDESIQLVLTFPPY